MWKGSRLCCRLCRHVQTVGAKMCIDGQHLDLWITFKATIVFESSGAGVVSPGHPRKCSGKPAKRPLSITQASWHGGLLLIDRICTPHCLRGNAKVTYVPFVQLRIRS